MRHTHDSKKVGSLYLFLFYAADLPFMGLLLEDVKLLFEDVERRRSCSGGGGDR